MSKPVLLCHSLLEPRPAFQLLPPIDTLINLGMSTVGDRSISSTTYKPSLKIALTSTK